MRERRNGEDEARTHWALLGWAGLGLPWLQSPFSRSVEHLDTSRKKGGGERKSSHRQRRQHQTKAATRASSSSSPSFCFPEAAGLLGCMKGGREGSERLRCCTLLTDESFFRAQKPTPIKAEDDEERDELLDTY